MASTKIFVLIQEWKWVKIKLKCSYSKRSFKASPINEQSSHMCAHGTGVYFILL